LHRSQGRTRKASEILQKDDISLQRGKGRKHEKSRCRGVQRSLGDKFLNANKQFINTEGGGPGVEGGDDSRLEKRMG